jgi:hypothetical protein
MATILETFGDCVNEVLSFGFNDGPQVNKGRIERWINEAQNQIARQVEAPEFQVTEDMKLKQGAWKYPLPAGFLRMQDIYYPEMLTRLMPIDIQQFDLTAQQKLEGPPICYTIYATELWLFPTPNNSSDELELRFLRRPASLVNEGDKPTLNGDYLHLLVDYALGRAFKAEDDEESAQAHITQYKADLDAYATDVQNRMVDRPRILDGTWGSSTGRGTFY